MFRGVATKGYNAVLMDCGQKQTWVVKNSRVVRKTKGMRCVVFGRPKVYQSTEVAHRGGYYVAQLVERLTSNQNAVGSNPTIFKKSKDYFGHV